MWVECLVTIGCLEANRVKPDPNNNVMDNIAASLTAGVENHHFFGYGGAVPIEI